ncbi:hypothetical protein KGF54_005568 [Candida jiufengensis]|uniref:uncharacterized protein n=1 Tax=Candida jiufengensis TaxID=497108 RepID=UPI0022250835|nr:uncharacterized protein KGF54_005568 [Candida jiufengensis]KAI5949333.1 hypothetical protein KGF54_005568 [Candida jiufengensis]
MAADIDHTCRICRGEGTPNQPLYHPCKCRGSIKYIHQDCLLEWLKHSNKSTEKCDICNTNYKFKIIYDPNMPKTIPLNLIWSKFIQLISDTFIKMLSISLYITCVLIQVPIFWKFCGRIYTWAIDGSLPINNQDFLNALYFGEYDIVSLIKNNSNMSSLQLMLLKLRTFFSYTYFSGVRYLVVAIIVHIALFVEREWVIRDEGYLKLLHRKIGKEPKTKLVDMLQNALDSLRRGENEDQRNAATNIQRLDQLNRAINDLQDQGNDQMINFEENLRRAMNRGELFNGDRNEERQHILNRVEDSDGSDEPVGEDIEILNENDLVVEEPEPNLFDQMFDDEEDGEDIDDDALPNNNNGAIGEFLEIFGFTLNIKTPLFIMVLCDAIITAYLFLIYLVPHLIGNGFVFVTGFILKYISSFTPHIVNEWISVINELRTTTTNNEVLNFLLASSNEIFMVIKNLINDLFFQKPPQLTLVERSCLILIGYSIIIGFIHQLMKHLISKKRPILGTSRKVFKILFEISSTAKVFLIFAIEIFLFPVYCGSLLDICAAPLFMNKPNGVLTSSSELTQISYVRVSIYWLSGTIYMLIFALFVGMVRSNILRPGVLFFIRSPDDPNARLIHDALVKPLSLQLSRIVLSGKVYTAFIVFGIGSVTWGLRYLVTPDHGKYNVMLPIQVNTNSSLFTSLAFFVLANELQPVITKYIRMYWKRAFEISAHKLRLSHFILGKPISHERGHIIYRNFTQQILGTAQPDYSKPVTYREAQEIFKSNPQVNACFVPDGFFVRAPGNDTVTRKFVKKLFVPVTKDDKLLKDVSEEDIKSSGYETPSSEEEELNSDDVHTIVYRPPAFKTRCYGLILILNFFAICLIVGTIVSALILGRPLVYAASSLLSFIPYIGPTEIDWKLADLTSLSTGLIIELKILSIVDKHYQQIGTNEINDRPNALQRILDVGVFNLNATSTVSFLISYSLWTAWMVSIHMIHLNGISIPFHLLASIWTILPVLKCLYNSKNLDPNFNQQLHKNGFYKVLKFSLVTHLPGLILGYLNKSKMNIIFTYSFLSFVLIRSFGTSIKLYKNLNEQVKIEKFVKGRAIENDDEDDINES